MRDRCRLFGKKSKKEMIMSVEVEVFGVLGGVGPPNFALVPFAVVLIVE